MLKLTTRQFVLFITKLIAIILDIIHQYKT